METYTCEGNVVMIQSRPEDGGRVRMTCRDDKSDTAPTMLEAAGRVARYVREVMRTESDERYARKEFYFDRWCFCTRIDVLGKDGRAVKSVGAGTKGWKPFLGVYENETGEEGVIDSEQ